jgi:hypothetical protein
MRSDHRHLTAYQIGCEVGQSVGLAMRPAILDRHILALDVAGFTKALPKCGQIACTISKRRAAEEPDYRWRSLLPVRRERPRRGHAANEHDEFPPPHGAYPKAKGHGPEYSSVLERVQARAAQQKPPAHVRVGSESVL